ncbi:f-BAR domain only protein 1 [Scleropages formosus]|uniref:F-BAR domain only protein 1-like n=1 Tax=Scleropages formosus TaxID=113540 RepID=A0A8C9QTQ3_SCLFO|nr:F-BAR domain only protein 1-like [Scleropages formosus]
MALFKSNFWGEKNAGFDVLYHNMKHGQLATKELAEFVRERAAIEETYSKSMSKLAKMASNGSSLGTFAPMWDLFRVSADKLALCHLELMRKMNDLIRDINKYGDEQVKVHRKMKEGAVGTVEAIQALQVHNGQLQKSRENHLTKRAELERLRREGAPHKELEKAELKLKKAAASFSCCIEKYNRVAGDFELKMSDSAQRFQDIEETHLRQMKQLIKSYLHSIEDTHVQLGQVHEELKQNVENIGTENLIQKFAEQKGTGKDKPTLVGLEDHRTNPVPEGSKKSRGRSFRIPGLGKKDKEPDSMNTTATNIQKSHEVDEEGFVIRTDHQDRCPQEREENFYSSDSDFDDDEPKKFHILIRPVGSSTRCNSAANELELRATVGALTLPPNRGVSMKRHLSRTTSCTADACLEGVRDGVPNTDKMQDGVRRSVSSPDRYRLNFTPATEVLFGPPLETTFIDAAFSSESSSPEIVEDSGLDSPSHQPMGPSPEPNNWAAWPGRVQNKYSTGAESESDPFQPACAEPPSRCLSSVRTEPVGLCTQTPCSPHHPSGRKSAVFSFAAFSQCPREAEQESSQWNCKHIFVENPLPSPSERSASPEQLPPQEPWVPGLDPARSLLSQEGSRFHSYMHPSSGSHSECKTFPSSSTSHKEKNKDITVGVPALDSSEDPFSITMIGSPTHQFSLATGTSQWSSCSTTSSLSSSASSSQPKKEMGCWSSVHNPFSEAVPAGMQTGLRGGGKRLQSSDRGPRRSGLPLTRHSGPQEDLRISADKKQSCHKLTTPPPSPRESTEFLLGAPPHSNRTRVVNSRMSGCELSRSLCSSPLPALSPILSPALTCSSSSPSEWGGHTFNPRAHSPHRGVSRGPSPISQSSQESWPVAAAITEYINAYFPGGQHSRCLVKITGDFTMSFPAGITVIFAANPNIPVLSFRLVNLGHVENILPNKKLLCSGSSQSGVESREFWFNMQALSQHLQKEAELNPQASYYNVGLVKYQVSSQDPGHAPMLLCAECQRSGTVTRVSLDYRWCPAMAPDAQLTSTQVLLPLDHTASDVQCQPPGAWNAEERRLLWKLPDFSPSSHSKGSSHTSGQLCASWQSSELSHGPNPSLAVQFVGTGASLSGLDVELVGSRYRMSLVKKRFATGKYVAGCSL